MLAIMALIANQVNFSLYFFQYHTLKLMKKGIFNASEIASIGAESEHHSKICYEEEMYCIC